MVIKAILAICRTHCIFISIDTFSFYAYLSCQQGEKCKQVIKSNNGGIELVNITLFYPLNCCHYAVSLYGMHHARANT